MQVLRACTVLAQLMYNVCWVLPTVLVRHERMNSGPVCNDVLATCRRLRTSWQTCMKLACPSLNYRCPSLCTSALWSSCAAVNTAQHESALLYLLCGLYHTVAVSPSVTARGLRAQPYSSPHARTAANYSRKLETLGVPQIEQNMFYIIFGCDIESIHVLET
jgi:hypothetical protein